MSVFHCGMPPLCPRNWGGGTTQIGGGAGHAKKNFRRFAPEFVPQLQNRVGAYAPSRVPPFPSLFLPLLSPLRSPSLSLPSSSLPSVSPPLRNRPLTPLNPARGWRSAVSFPSGVWGGAPAEIEFSAF